MIDDKYAGKNVKVICHDGFTTQGYAIMIGTYDSGEDFIDIEVSYGIEELPESEIKEIQIL